MLELELMELIAARLVKLGVYEDRDAARVASGLRGH